MAHRVYLHVGAPKTATTYLQGLLEANRAALADQGVLWPGARVDHFRMAMAVTGRTHEMPKPRQGEVAWRRVAEAAAEWPGTVVVSNEMLSVATPEQATAALESFAPAELHLIYTARDPARTIPSEWQQSLRAGGTLGLDDYVAAIRSGSADAAWFESMHGLEGVLHRWGSSLPTDHVHLVTLPATADPAAVWHRFAAVVGFDPAGCPAGSVERPNTSLDPVSAELLRLVNVRLFTDVSDRRALIRWVRRTMVLSPVLGRASSARIVLRGDDHAWAVERAVRMVAALQASGYDVSGDLADLVPDREPPTGVHPDGVDPGELAVAATEALAALLRRSFDSAGASDPDRTGPGGADRPDQQD